MNGEKTRYRVILLLVVGLTAFSSAMRELNQFQQFTLDTSRLIAHLTEKIAPAHVPQTAEIAQTAPKSETCEIKQSLPAVELPWLTNDTKPRAVVPRPSQIIEARHIERQVRRTKDFGFQFAKLKKLPQFEIDPVAFEFKIPVDHPADPDNVNTSELPLTTFRAKTRKHSSYKFSTRDREMLLKTLNRSLNLRIAS